MSAPEVWLRGVPVPNVPALLQPVAHSLLQCREELTAALAGLTPDQLWQRPNGAASIGFHAPPRCGSSSDRLLTYARGESLSPAQMAALRSRKRLISRPMPPPRSPPGSMRLSSARWRSCGKRASRRCSSREASAARGFRPRCWALFHAAEHTQRHVGQLVTTGKVIGR